MQVVVFVEVVCKSLNSGMAGLETLLNGLWNQESLEIGDLRLTLRTVERTCDRGSLGEGRGFKDLQLALRTVERTSRSLPIGEGRGFEDLRLILRTVERTLQSTLPAVGEMGSADPSNDFNDVCVGRRAAGRGVSRS